MNFYSFFEEKQSGAKADSGMNLKNIERTITENFSGNPSLFLKYSVIFLKNLSGYIDELSQCIEKDRFEDAAKVLHRVRGTVAIFGFEETCQMMKEFEKALLTNNENELDKFYEQTVENLMQLEAVLKEYQEYVKAGDQ